MGFFKTTHWPGLLAVALLVTATTPAAQAADTDTGAPGGATLWDTVKATTRQLIAIGDGTVRSLNTWLANPGGGSRLASTLLGLTNTDVRDLDSLVDQAGYRLEDITIRLCDPSLVCGPSDVTLGFSYRHPADATRQTELRSTLDGSTLTVDDDTRALIGALLDAGAHAGSAPSDRLALDRVEVRLGRPPVVRLDFSARPDHPNDGMPPPAIESPQPMPAMETGTAPQEATAAPPVLAEAAPVAGPPAAPEPSPEPAATAASPAPEPVPPATARAEAPAPSQAYRIVRARVYGHAGPGLHEPVIRALTPSDRLTGTGNRHHNWVEVTLTEGQGSATRLWVYDSVIAPAR